MNGQLIGIVDNFDKTIKFEYTDLKMTPSRIIDSLGQVVIFKFNLFRTQLTRGLTRTEDNP